MTPKRKNRLKIIAFILFGATCSVGLLIFGLGNNMNHYYDLSVVKKDIMLVGKTIRIGGVVEEGSIQRTKGSLKLSFRITNLKDSIYVTYEGILPDLFKEGQGVLAKGVLLDTSVFLAEEILAKHDENYMPKEVRDELEKSGYYKRMEANSSENQNTEN